MPPLLDYNYINKTLKAELPHQSAYIDRYPKNAGYYLLNELQDAILRELKNMLTGADADQEAIAQSATIMAAVKATSKQMTELQRPPIPEGTSTPTQPEPSA
jgi:hypothetical protein